MDMVFAHLAFASALQAGAQLQTPKRTIALQSSAKLTVAITELAIQQVRVNARKAGRARTARILTVVKTSAMGMVFARLSPYMHRDSASANSGIQERNVRSGHCMIRCDDVQMTAPATVSASMVNALATSDSAALIVVKSFALTRRRLAHNARCRAAQMIVTRRGCA